MRALACPTCALPSDLGVLRCLRCATELTFDWEHRRLVVRRDACANRDVLGCNGAAARGRLCTSCRLTRRRPADGDPAGMAQWRVAEEAKRLLLYGVLDLGLVVVGHEDAPVGLAFDMLSGTNARVSTGYLDGTVTLDLTEADDGYREQTRVALREPTRTVLGHLRHEIGHHFQPVLAPEGSVARIRCRRLFGDDRADYDAALQRHYRDGPPADWAAQHVSAYASAHPSEDWAETFAYYLTMRDVLQTVAAHDVHVGRVCRPGGGTTPGFATVLETWALLARALNAISRSFGAGDVQPLIPGGPAAEKLAFIDGLVRSAANPSSSDSASRTGPTSSSTTT